MIISLIISAILLIVGIKSIIKRGDRDRAPALISCSIVYIAAAITAQIFIYAENTVMNIGGAEIVISLPAIFNIAALIIGLIFMCATIKINHGESIFVPIVFSGFLIIPLFIFLGIGWLMQQEGEFAGAGDISILYYWIQLIVLEALSICTIYYDYLPEGLTDPIEDIIAGMEGHEYQ